MFNFFFHFLTTTHSKNRGQENMFLTTSEVGVFQKFSLSGMHK